MPVDLKLLESHGLTSEKLKAQFTADKPSEKTTHLIDYIRDVLRESIEHNVRESAIYKAIDKAYDVSFSQTSYTLAAHLLEQYDDPAKHNDILSTIKDMGLTHLLVPYCPVCKSTTCNKGCTCKTKSKALNLPLLKQLHIPLVKAYQRRAWAKMFNSRDSIPHYPYHPRNATLKEKIKCDLITEQIDIQANNCGYRADRQQAYFNALLYGTCLKFPRKAWTQKTSVETDEDGNEKERIEWEGILFTFPHPSKAFVDPAFRPCTLNSGTGCRYAGYWDICRWSEIDDDPGYWNKDKVGFNDGDWFTTLPITNYMANLYPCTMKWPTFNSTRDTNDREVKIGLYGTGTERNAAFVRTNLFLCLNPKTHGLGDGKYDHDLWFRFVMGATDTVMYVEPYAYDTPVIYYGIEADGNRIRNSSMGLDCLPFQDQLGNIITQNLVTVAKNLTSIVFWNSDVVEETDVAQVQAIGDRAIKSTVFIEYSKDKLNNIMRENAGEAFIPLTLPQHSISEGLAMVNVLISIMDRVLSFSSQEVGAAASHQQSKYEAQEIAENVDNRSTFTESFADDAERADKRMLWQAFFAYGPKTITVSVDGVDEEKKGAIKELGLELVGEPQGTELRAKIRGPKKIIDIDNFAHLGKADNRGDFAGVISGIATILTTYVNNPLLLEYVGPKQIVEWTNRILQLSNISGFAMKGSEKNLPPQGQELQKMIVEISQKVSEQSGAAQGQQIIKTIGEGGIKPLKDQVDQLAQALQQVAQGTQQAIQQSVQPVGQAIQVLAQKQQQTEAVLSETAQALQRLEQIFAASQAPAPALTVS